MATLPTIDLDFTEQPPIPEAGIARANELMTSGRLFRYGETQTGEGDVAELEAAVAAMGGAAVFTGLALAASKARASSSFSDGGVAGLDDVVAEPVAE